MRAVAFAFVAVEPAAQPAPTRPELAPQAAHDDPSNGRRKNALIVLAVLTAALSGTIACVFWMALHGKSDVAKMLCETAIPTELAILGITAPAVWS